jgi:HD-like signal output (HDOD) protein
VHDIGIFYLLYRAAAYPEYRNNETAMLELISGWHESIGESLLHILGLPESVVDAIRDHDHLKNIETPCSVRDVLYFANLLAISPEGCLPADMDPAEVELMQSDRERYIDLLNEAEEDILELHAALAV